MLARHLRHLVINGEGANDRNTDLPQLGQSAWDKRHFQGGALLKR